MCIYTKDFNDKPDIERVYRMLRKILSHFQLNGYNRKTLSYKADIITLAIGSSVKNAQFWHGEGDGVIESDCLVTHPGYFDNNKGRGLKVTNAKASS